MKNDDNELKIDIGRHCTIRSSKTRVAMIGWDSLKFDAASRRWFERDSYGFTDWCDAKYFQETTDLEIDEKHEEFPNMSARESFCEVVYAENEDTVADTWLLLVEYEEGKPRIFRISLQDITDQQMKEVEHAVKRWHKSGEFRTDAIECCPCFGT